MKDWTQEVTKNRTPLILPAQKRQTKNIYIFFLIKSDILQGSPYFSMQLYNFLFFQVLVG